MGQQGRGDNLECLLYEAAGTKYRNRRFRQLSKCHAFTCIKLPVPREITAKYTGKMVKRGVGLKPPGISL